MPSKLTGLKRTWTSVIETSTRLGGLLEGFRLGNKMGEGFGCVTVHRLGLQLGVSIKIDVTLNVGHLYLSHTNNNKSYNMVVRSE